jgi:hypothetical protein
MASPQTTASQWILCPRCHIANLAAGINCSSCGAALDPNAPPPKHPSGASPKQWVLFIGISAFLIGSAIWAGVSPHSIAAKMYGAFLPMVYFAALLYGFGRSFLRFRKRDVSGGILQCALTVLFALAMLPAILDLSR